METLPVYGINLIGARRTFFLMGEGAVTRVSD